MEKIIVIESDEILRKFLSDRLKSLNFEVICCKDGFEGIIKIKNEIPDLIIMNLILDRMDAFQILREKLEYKTTSNIPVLVITPRNDQEINQKLLKARVNKILPKPLKLDILMQFISDLFRLKLDIDKTESLVEAHMNDDVLFVEIADGLNSDKIEILRYKVMQIKSIYKKHLSKILIIFSNIPPSEKLNIKLDLLFDILLEETEAGKDHIKILSSSEAILSGMAFTKHKEIEICSDFTQAIDALGKIDIFAFGDEVDEIKHQLITKNEHETHHDQQIAFSFSSEKQNLKDTYKIAIIDDDLYTLEFMATVLYRENWIINTYENPKTFLREFPENKPDLIFLDLMMPEMNGFQFAKYLSERNIFIPTVIVTALSQKEMVIKAREFGITNFLTKPVKSETLISKAEEVLKMSI